MIAFTTNMPKVYDPAFVRRILMHIDLGVPDVEARLALWRRMLRPAIPGRAQIDFARLAHETEGLSGGDIKNAVVLSLCGLADEPAQTRSLTIERVLDAVAAIRRNKQHVGSTHRQTTVSVLG